MVVVRRPGALVDAKKLPGRPLEAEEGSGLEEEDVGSAGSPVLSRGGVQRRGAEEGPEGTPVWEETGQGVDPALRD